VVDFSKKYKYYLSKGQQYLLVYTVYTVFCTTFAKGESAGIGNVFLMVLFQLLLMILVKILAWNSLKFLFRSEPKICVAGLYACTQKTIALGVPLIASIYQHNPNKGLYTLPILVWHPMQLVVGSLISSRLADFVARESERLGIKEDESADIHTTSEVEEGAEEHDVERIGETTPPADHDLALQVKDEGGEPR
jgi:sodium/bile acid cotransporter 7